MKRIALFFLALMTTAAPAQIQYYSPDKIDSAMRLLEQRGFTVDRDFVISIEMNRGKFPDARTLADYIQAGLQ